jgi:hypothetical protein
MRGLVLTTGIVTGIVGVGLLATGISIVAQSSERVAALIFHDCDAPDGRSSREQDCRMMYETEDGQFIARTAHVAAGEAVPLRRVAATVDQRAPGVWSPWYERRRTVSLALIVSGALLLALGAAVGYVGWRSVARG